MHSAVRFICAWALAVPMLCPQQPAAGLPPEWETRRMLTALVDTAKRLDPLLAQLNPEAWKENGAPDAYVQQLESTRRSLAVLQQAADRLSREPNKLTYALDAYFRVQSMELMLGSLAGGVRRYQNPAVADLITGIANENGANRDALRQYMTELAAVREAEFQVVDSEAQRCRGAISKQPPPATPKKAKP